MLELGGALEIILVSRSSVRDGYVERSSYCTVVGRAFEIDRALDIFLDILSRILDMRCLMLKKYIQRCPIICHLNFKISYDF